MRFVPDGKGGIVLRLGSAARKAKYAKAKAVASDRRKERTGQMTLRLDAKLIYSTKTGRGQSEFMKDDQLNPSEDKQTV